MKKIPSGIPSNWTWTAMGEIADVIGGGTPRTNDPENYDGGTIPWITPADLSGYTAKHISQGKRYITQKGLSESSARMLPAGTVLFSSRAPVGYVAIASNPVCTNQGFKSFVLRSDRILSDYVYWWLKGSKDLAESLASGTTFLELSGAKAKQIPIPIAPLEQQKIIVTEIEKQFSRLDEATLLLKRVKANLKRYKASVLKAAVEGKLTEGWRRQHPELEPASKLLERILAEHRAKWTGKGKYKEPTAPDMSDLTNLPHGWIWTSIDQIAEIGTGATPKRGKSKYYEGGNIPWITSSALNREYVDGAIEFVTDAALDETNLTLYPPGTLLLAMYGEGKTRGKCSELRISATTNQAIAAIQCAPQVRNYLKQALGGQYEDLRRKALGGVQPNLNLSLVRAIRIPLPPHGEQDQIVAEVERRLSVIEELEATVEANLTRAERLRQSILARAFAGKLVNPALQKRPDSSHDFPMAAESPSTYGAAR